MDSKGIIKRNQKAKSGFSEYSCFIKRPIHLILIRKMFRNLQKTNQEKRIIPKIKLIVQVL
jgi:hypothetical protein